MFLSACVPVSDVDIDVCMRARVWRFQEPRNQYNYSEAASEARGQQSLRKAFTPT